MGPESTPLKKKYFFVFVDTALTVHYNMNMEKTKHIVYHLSFFNPHTGNKLVLLVPFDDTDEKNSLDSAIELGENIARADLYGYIFEGVSS